MSYKINEAIRTVTLREAYAPESFTVKRNFKPLWAALPFFAMMVVVCAALAYVGDTFNILTYGEGAHAGNVPGFIGMLFFFGGLCRLAKAADTINNEKTQEGAYRRQRYSREVLMPVIKREFPDLMGMADLMAEQLIREGRAGMWSRIRGTNDGTVYEFTVKADVLTITTHVQVAESSDTWMGRVN